MARNCSASDDTKIFFLPEAVIRGTLVRSKLNQALSIVARPAKFDSARTLPATRRLPSYLPRQLYEDNRPTTTALDSS